MISQSSVCSAPVKRFGFFAGSLWRPHQCTFFVNSLLSLWCNSGTSQDGENRKTWIKLLLALALLLGDPERWGQFLLWGVFPGWRAGATSPHHVVTRLLAQNLWQLFTPGRSGPTGWSLTVRFGGGSMGIMGFPWKTVTLLEMEYPHGNSHWAALY